jgi:hypothetical protein
MSKQPMHETDYGFVWGPAEVTRLHSTENGYVILEVMTKRANLQVTVTPTGLIRTHQTARRKARP